MHLVMFGMDKDYRTWFHHGEDPDVSRTTNNVDSSAAYNLFSSAETFMMNSDGLGDGIGAEEFSRVLADAESPLYKGCSKHTKLSTIIGLYNMKTKHGCLDASFNELLELQ